VTEKRKPIDLSPDAHAKLREIAAREGLTMRAALAKYAVPVIKRRHAKLFGPVAKPRSADHAAR
jgi:hypothetical protein